MTRQQAAAAIREKFPDAKVLFLDECDHHFVDGIGVEYKDKRNAYALKDPEAFPEVVVRLMAWLERQ
jgi:hypothetical protein